MFKKVIVGDDGLDGGADALALAQAIAPDAELIVACAFPWDATPSRFVQLGYGNILRDDTEKALRKRTADVEGARTVAIPDTSPARALHHLADREHADLIVTGSARHGGVGRMFLGDVSRDVLHGSPCPVAVAPRGYATRKPATIGVAFDHSPEAVKALALAVDVATTLGASLRVREVVGADVLPAIAGYPMVNVETFAKEIVEEAQERLDGVVDAIDAEVHVEAEAVASTTAEGLAHLADEVDLVVCGSRGWGAVRRVVLGSAANRLIHHSSTPVLVVPRTADAAPAADPDEAVSTTA